MELALFGKAVRNRLLGELKLLQTEERNGPFRCDVCVIGHQLPHCRVT